MQGSTRIERMRDAIEGCLVGGAVANAIAMPWQGFTWREILKITHGNQVSGLQDVPTGIERKIPEMRSLALGSTTAPWQLTKVVASSILCCKKFNLFDQAHAHVEASMSSTIGWGETTRDAIAEIKRRFDSEGREGRRPDEPPAAQPDRGMDNGVIMKIAPLVCLQLLCEEADTEDPKSALMDWVRALGAMTHPDKNAMACAMFMAHVLNEQLDEFESPPNQSGDVMRLIDHPQFRLVRDIEPIKTVLGNREKRGDILSAPTLLRECAGWSSLASATTAFALGMFSRQSTDFRTAILETVNTGCVTDADAAVVGTLVGACVGFSGIPSEWIAAIPDAATAKDFADALVNTFVGNKI